MMMTRSENDQAVIVETGIGHGRIDDGVHVFPVRVYYEDTDSAGIVYYANYLRFMERGRTELLRSLGGNHIALSESEGVLFAVRRCEIDYLSPARLDDALEVRTRMLDIGGAAFQVEQTIWRAHQKLIHAEVRLACLNLQGRPARMPASVRAALKQFANVAAHP
ncbi:Acyl-CoA thioesterase YbgC [Azospirillaceae bacterium]